MAVVRSLGTEDAAALVALRREALETEPLAFAASIQDDQGLSVELVRKWLADTAESAVLGFYREEKLVGMAGIYRVAKVKSRHKAHVWGMYVRPAYRAKGVGNALLRAVIEQAGRWPGVTQIHLSVTEAAPAARRLYERSGFQEWGNEPSGLCWEGHCVDERHMVLRLGSAPQARVGG